MDKRDISKRFYVLVAPSHPNEWEIDDTLSRLALLPDESCTLLLDQIPAIWPVSHSLTFRYLKHGADQMKAIPPELLPEWVRQLLFYYETGGLRVAETFMSDTKTNFLSRYHRDSDVSLEAMRRSLTHYIRGVSGCCLSIAEDAQVWTDTDTIFLPPELNIGATTDENRLLYKFLLTYQSTLVRLRIFALFTGHGVPDRVSRITSGSEQADVLFRIFLFIKGAHDIRNYLPGLWSRSAPLIRSHFISAEDEGIRHMLEACWHMIETGPGPGKLYNGGWSEFLQEYEGFREKFIDLERHSLSQAQRYIIGVLNVEKAAAAMAQRREKDKKAFVNMLARVLMHHQVEQEVDADRTVEGNRGEAEADGTIAVISEALAKVSEKEERCLLRIDNTNVVVPDELIDAARSIISDIGSIPVGYVQAAAGLAGGGRTGNGLSTAGFDAAITNTGSENGYVYDEWDCRRNGYRRDWCTVIEEELPAERSDFTARTLRKHSGLRKRLKMQFEMMRTVHRYVRRQRDGDDLDLDAIIDMMGDAKAGAAVSERLFVRLERDRRDISALFLIDMSNSTSGWIGTFIKEALVLLCEAMEKVGDRYGIYGFSGMRRSRCRLYHIKTFDECYDDSVRQRISAIGPKDYTRMAPAVRHLTSILDKTDSRTRLLITLSDGKPEDYDGYNGEYAIEDTKKALLEAQGKGVKPFCITVDKHCHDYLDHMFGPNNYIFINKIESLPAKMSHVYRVLTG